MGRTRLTRHLAALVVVTLAASMLCSCAGVLGGKPEIRQKRRFLIPVEPIRGGLNDSERPYTATVQLRAFDIARSYSQIEIVVRDSRYELRRDPLHTWSQRPASLITDAVFEYLRQAQLFTRLVSDRDLLDQSPDYILNGTVTALERFDSGDRWFARLTMSMQLVRTSDSQVIWRGAITPEEELEVFNRDMAYTVQSISEILRRGMQRLVREIDFIFLNMQRRQVVTPDDLAALADSARTTPA